LNCDEGSDSCHYNGKRNKYQEVKIHRHSPNCSGTVVW
jgi:hypothetical protein